MRGDELQGGAPLGLAGTEGVFPAAKHGLRDLGGVNQYRLAEGLPHRGALDLVNDVFADGDLRPLHEAGPQRQVVDGDGGGASSAVWRDRRRRPERRLGHGRPRELQVRRLAIENHPERIPARYGATRLRTYFAIMSSSRFTRSPTRAVPRLVRRRVSGMSAAPKVDRSSSLINAPSGSPPSGSMMVRETPSTAMEPLLTTRPANSRG